MNEFEKKEYYSEIKESRNTDKKSTVNSLIQTKTCDAKVNRTEGSSRPEFFPEIIALGE
ncbi:hypothetical protein IKQ19_19450 [Candidatus Saccharibacteria bacterium]|nr:hypothetical protein [Candidatus Saccharibacteria bacterium]